MAGMKRQSDSPFGTPDSKKGAFSSSGCVLRPSSLSDHSSSIRNSPFSQVGGMTMKAGGSSGSSPFILKPATLQAPSPSISSQLKYNDKIEGDTVSLKDESTKNETENTDQSHPGSKHSTPPSSQGSTGGKTENKDPMPNTTAGPVVTPATGGPVTANTPTSATRTKSSVHNPFLPMDENDQSFVAAGRVFGQNIDSSVMKSATDVDILKQGMKTPIKSDLKLSAAKTSTFVFGKNMCERVVKSPEASHNKSADTEPDEPKSKDKDPTHNNSELSFSQQAKEVDTQNPTLVEKEPDEETDKPATLEESAIAYEKSHVQTVSLDEVPIVTGEESERNVMQVSGKLYIFETDTQLWSERGRGILRLNDIGKERPLQSRVVMRTQGCLRVILNSKLFSKMTVEQVSKKSIRFSAMADDILKVYLLMTNQMDSSKLFSALDYRISNLRQWNKEHQHETDEGVSEEHSGLSAHVWGGEDSPLTEASQSASSSSDKDTRGGEPGSDDVGVKYNTTDNNTVKQQDTHLTQDGKKEEDDLSTSPDASGSNE